MNQRQPNRVVILVFGMICMLLMGICYTYSLFQPYIMERFGVDSATASLPFTIFIAIFCLGNFIGGRLQQKSTIRLTLIIGYVLMFAAWIMTAYIPANQFYLMYISFGVIFGIGDGIVYNVIVSLMPKWFPDRKGLASGLTLAMLGFSATLFSPLVSMWLKGYGFSKTFTIIAFIYLGVGVLGVLTMQSPPENYMLDHTSTGAHVAGTKQYEVSEALRTKEFWLITALYFCAVPAYLLLSAIFVTFGQNKGLTPAMATLGVSLASLAQVGGRFAVPTISDKIGRKKAFGISFLVTAIGVGLLAVAQGYFYVLCFCLISFSYGGSQACFSPIAADYYGTKNLGTILSLTMIGFGLGSIGASVAAKLVGPSTAFILAGGVALLGIILVSSLPNNRKLETKN